MNRASMLDKLPILVGESPIELGEFPIALGEPPRLMYESPIRAQPIHCDNHVCISLSILNNSYN